MGVLAWIIFGALAGWLASMVAGNDGEQGALGNILIGIVGAFIGGLIVSLFGGSGVTGFNLGSLLVAILGAVILLAVLGKFNRGRSTTI